MYLSAPKVLTLLALNLPEPSSTIGVLGSNTNGSLVVSKENINLALLRYFCKEDTLFCKVLGITYPYNFISNVLLTILILSCGNSVQY